MNFHRSFNCSIKSFIYLWLVAQDAVADAVECAHRVIEKNWFYL